MTGLIRFKGARAEEAQKEVESWLRKIKVLQRNKENWAGI